jgi:hypothetical protein
VPLEAGADADADAAAVVDPDLELLLPSWLLAASSSATAAQRGRTWNAPGVVRTDSIRTAASAASIASLDTDVPE